MPSITVAVCMSKITVIVCMPSILLTACMPMINVAVCMPSMTIIVCITILRKTIEGYLDSVPSQKFNTIKTLLIMHPFHSSRHLQSKWMLYFSHASMV